MILTCPNCGTQYVVKDGAIPPEGRQVRCASCKHSWHQDTQDSDTVGPVTPLAEAGPQESESPAAEDESLAEATLIQPRSGPEAEERAYEEAMAGAEPALPAAEDRSEPASAPLPDSGSGTDPVDDWREPPQAEAATDVYSPFMASDEEAGRKRSRPLTLLLIALVVAALAVAFWMLAPPAWRAMLGLGGAGASPLALVTTHMDRQRLASGNELLTVTGRVINPTGEEQDVPALQAQLRTRAGKIVYSWTIAPPARTLPAGASASFNSAEVNVPPGGDELTITLGKAKA